MDTKDLDFSLLFDDEVTELVTETTTTAIPTPSDLADGSWWG